LKEKLANSLNHRIFAISALAISTIILFIQADRRFGYTSSTPKNNFNIIADGGGYYSYLPQYFIYNDEPNYGFIDRIKAKYPGIQIGLSARKTENGYTNYNKYFVGTALLQSPFFLINHGIQKAIGGDADGYSLSYRFTLQIASIFYWLMGVICLFKLFKELHFSNFSILGGIILLTFGSNLNYYIAYYTSYSHIYSFGIISLFLWMAHCWVQTNSKKHLLSMAVLIGLLFIIRPTNVLVIFILPFLFKNAREFFERLLLLWKQQKSSLALFLFLTLTIVSLQLLNTYHQTGKMLFNSYEKEGFSNWMNPQFFNVLFSFEKGFFVYAPGLLIIILGMFLMFKKWGYYFALGWLFTILIHLYFICSWSTWHFGGGLGMRALIEFMPLYLFPIIAVFSETKKIVYAISIIVLITGIFAYQIFQNQYNQHIIDATGMNKEKFWKVFMKTEGRYAWMLNYYYEQLPSKEFNQEYQFYYKEGNWRTNNNDSFDVSLKDEMITIVKSKALLPKYAQLNGKVKIYDPVNNPAIESKYYTKGKIVYSNLQPFGNQINNVLEFEPIHLDFNPKSKADFDSIQFILRHFGERNDYKGLKLKVLGKR